MKKKIFLVIIIVLSIFFITMFFLYSRDCYHFQLEYQIYNHIAFTNGKKIKVHIPGNNKIQYVKQKNLKSILTEKTGIVYFGYSTCPWCRNIVPILIDTVKSSEIDTIYYVDVKKINTEEIRDLLEPYLKEDNEKQKRLYVPDVYFIKNGEIVDHHLGAVASYKDAFSIMSEEQKQELKEIYQSGIEKILRNERGEIK